MNRTKNFFKGEPQLRTKPHGKKKRFSGLSIKVSDADFNNLTQQIKDTIDFLKENKDKLWHISQTSEVEHATLDFGIELRIDFQKVVYQFERFPNELLKLAGDLGLEIELSLYPQSVEEPE